MTNTQESQGAWMALAVEHGSWHLVGPTDVWSAGKIGRKAACGRVICGAMSDRPLHPSPICKRCEAASRREVQS